MSEPIGSLCVLADEDRRHWLVSICQGGGRKLVLRRFESRDKAAEWAIEERGRRIAKGGTSVTINFPDDCPCTATCPLRW
jgi:hypothetical protein